MHNARTKTKHSVEFTKYTHVTRSKIVLNDDIIIIIIIIIIISTSFEAINDPD